MYVTLRSSATVFVAGWSFFWCTALHVIDAVPLWLPLLAVIAGLVMIPLSARQARSPGKLTLDEAAAPAAE